MKYRGRLQISVTAKACPSSSTAADDDHHHACAPHVLSGCVRLGASHDGMPSLTLTHLATPIMRVARLEVTQWEGWDLSQRIFITVLGGLRGGVEVLHACALESIFGRRSHVCLSLLKSSTETRLS